MSLPFNKRKADAKRLWGPEVKLVKVWVPAERGFIQVRRSGYYWVSAEQAKRLKLKKTEPKRKAVKTRGKRK